MKIYAEYHGQILKEATGIHIDGVTYKAEDIVKMFNSTDRLPPSHTVLEQSEFEGRVHQTVDDGEGGEYERVVSFEEAYGSQD